MSCSWWLESGRGSQVTTAPFPHFSANPHGVVGIARWPLGTRQTPGASHIWKESVQGSGQTIVLTFIKTHRDHLIFFRGLTQSLPELALARKH